MGWQLDRPDYAGRTQGMQQAGNIQGSTAYSGPPPSTKPRARPTYRPRDSAGCERSGQQAAVIIPRLERGPAGVKQLQNGIEVGPWLRSGRAVVRVHKLE